MRLHKFNAEKELKKLKNKDTNFRKKALGLLSFAVVFSILGFSYSRFIVSNTSSVINSTIDSFEPYVASDFKVTGTNGTTAVYGMKGDGYLPTVTCTDGSSATFNTKNWSLDVTAIGDSKSNCTITYANDTSTKTYLNNHIISLAGNGQVVNENGYRYEGKSPNNYIWFNNELWRIIGVFDDATHGITGTNLVKIMRDSSIGGLAWDKSNTNDWTTSSLMNLLNTSYLNQENGTGSAYCYGYSTTSPSNCDYREIGINSTYRNMIENVTWHLGGSSTNSQPAATFYTDERGTTVYSGRPTTWSGKIGLMYPSDYGYSVLGSSCARTTNLNSYSGSTCAGQSWMYKEGFEWTISPYSSGSFIVFYLGHNGSVGIYDCAYYGYGGRPSLYLKSNTYIIGGDGTIKNPYIIN